MLRRNGAMAAVLVFAAVVGTVAAQKALPAIGDADSEKLRKMIPGALADAGGKVEKELLAYAKVLEGKYAHTSLVEALAKGPIYPSGEPAPRSIAKKLEKFARFEQTVVGYTFVHDGAVYRYAVDIPKNYDPRKPTALLVDPGHGGGAQADDRGKADYIPFWRREADDGGLEGCLIARTEIIEEIGAGGKRGDQPEEAITAVFRVFFRDVLSRFNVDPSKIYVTGLSQTGFWAWYLGKARPDRYAGIAPMSAVTWQVNQYLPNLALLPIGLLHGDADKVCNVDQPRMTRLKLIDLKANLNYVEIPGAGHDGQVFSKLDEMLKWLLVQEHSRVPKKFDFHLQSTAEPWCYFARVDAIEKEGTRKAQGRPTAKLKVEVDGQAIVVTSEGVSKATIALSKAVCDLESPIEIHANKKPIVKYVAKPSFQKTVQMMLERCDWRILFDDLVTVTL